MSTTDKTSEVAAKTTTNEADVDNDTASEKPATAPQGFEEFDLDDIEVIESKVFA